MPPANLAWLRRENTINNPHISLAPRGGQGWGSTTKKKIKTEETNGNQQQSLQSQPASSLSKTTQKTSTKVSTSGEKKAWSSVNIEAWSKTRSQDNSGQERNFLDRQSPFFAQEFPKLDGGKVPTEGYQKSNVDSQYGSGPSLRPERTINSLSDLKSDLGFDPCQYSLDEISKLVAKEKDVAPAKQPVPYACSSFVLQQRSNLQHPQNPLLENHSKRPIIFLPQCCRALGFPSRLFFPGYGPLEDFISFMTTENDQYGQIA